MLDFFQKAFLAGVGATAVTMEKIEKSLQEFVEKGKLTQEEARKAAEKIMEDGKEEFEGMREQWNQSVDDLLKKSNVATRSQIESLTVRLENLERQVNVLSKAKAEEEETSGEA